jgi:hypothetical protein
MQGLSTIAAKNLTWANTLRDRGGFIITKAEIDELISIDRFIQVLVRCGNGRFVCSVQDVLHFITIIDQHRESNSLSHKNADSDYIRDISLPA